MTHSSRGAGAASARKGRLHALAQKSGEASAHKAEVRPHGEASSARPLRSDAAGGADSARPNDPLTARAIAAVERKAAELGVELGGRVWVRSKGKQHEVHAGRPKIGTLTQDQFVRADVDALFLLHRSIWLDVVAIDKSVTWAQWAMPLRAAQWALGHLMDATLDEIRLATRAGHKGAFETLAYQVLTSESEQDKLRQQARARYEKTKSATWLARSQFSLGGGVCAAAQRVLMTAMKRWENDEIGYPSWKGPSGSIPIREQELKLRQDGDDTRCSMTILGGRGHAHSCIVAAKGDSARAQLRKILSNEYKHGGGKLIWDERKRRWRLSIAYMMPRPKLAEHGAATLVVRRSVEDLLFVMSEEGLVPSRVLRGIGYKIIHLRKQYLARRRRVRTEIDAQGRGARGHGKRRFLRRLERLSDNERAAIDTRLGQIASAIRRAVKDVHARRVIVEDLSLPWEPVGPDRDFVKMLKRMPWAKANDMLRLELEEHGIRMEKTSQAHMTSECPAGRMTVESSIHVVRRDGRYVDCSCGLYCSAPMVAGWHMLLDASVDCKKLLIDRMRASRFIREAKQLKEKADEAAQ